VIGDNPAMTLQAIATILALATAAGHGFASELAEAIPTQPGQRAAVQVEAAAASQGGTVSATMDPDAARAALASAAAARVEYERAWQQRRADCFQRFFVNACLEELRQQRWATERRLDAVELAARRALREHAAIERNRREAERLELDAAGQLRERQELVRPVRPPS
jgi:hypothetical protein